MSAAFVEFEKLVKDIKGDKDVFTKATTVEAKAWGRGKHDNGSLKASAKTIAAHGEHGHALSKEADYATKIFSRLIEAADSENAKTIRDTRQASKRLEETRGDTTSALGYIRYFTRHAQWLQDRFPDAALRDVEGLVKLVDLKELEANDWSLTPGRYVGVAPQEEDEDFDFEETMREIHGELADLNTEAVELATKIAKNFEALVI